MALTDVFLTAVAASTDVLLMAVAALMEVFRTAEAAVEVASLVAAAALVTASKVSLDRRFSTTIFVLHKLAAVRILNYYLPCDVKE